MSTQSPNFNLTIATTSDQVNVVTQIANNFSTLDTMLSYVHATTGGIKPSTFLPVPQLSSPTVTGSMTGVFSITASTGLFNTVTCTSGNVTFGYVGIGTYSLPTTLGSTGALLTVQTGNAQWVSPSGGTGANTGLSNLASVAINTNLNSFTASAVTMSAVIATSGSLTGLTVFQATTGTFAGNVSITGTLTANAVVHTGGIGTYSSLSVGTYAMPATLGSNSTVLFVTTGALNFYAPGTPGPSFSYVSINSAQATATSTIVPTYNAQILDASSVVTTGGTFTVSVSGTYEINAYMTIINSGGASCTAGVYKNGVAFINAIQNGGSGTTPIPIAFITPLTSGDVISLFVKNAAAAGSLSLSNTSLNGAGYFNGKRLYSF